MDFQPDYNHDPSFSPQDKSSSSMSFASVAFGIVSIVTSCFGTSLIFGSLGMILALLSRGGSNSYSKPTMIGLILNIIGVAFGVLLLLTAIIAIISFGSIENFMSASQSYMDAYYSAYGIMQ